MQDPTGAWMENSAESSTKHDNSGVPNKNEEKVPKHQVYILLQLARCWKEKGQRGEKVACAPTVVRKLDTKKAVNPQEFWH